MLGRRRKKVAGREVITKNIALCDGYSADCARPHYFSDRGSCTIHSRTFYGRVDAPRDGETECKSSFFLSFPPLSLSLSLLLPLFFKAPFRSHIFTSDPREKKQNHSVRHSAIIRSPHCSTRLLFCTLLRAGRLSVYYCYFRAL